MQTDASTLITTRIQSVLADALQVPPEQVTPELAFGDLLQWDSMGHMEVLMALEAHFGVDINADTIAGLVSVPAIRAYLEANGHV